VDHEDTIFIYMSSHCVMLV